MKKISLLGKIKSTLLAHKIVTAVIVVTCIGGGYQIYRSAKIANAAPQYVLDIARQGTLTQTVTGSGQVSAIDQLDVKSQVSGTILSINAAVGQHVYAGDLIAVIDSQNASIDLQNSKLALQKLIQPAKATDLSNTTNSVVKAYNDGFNSVSGAFLDLPAIMTGMKDLLYGRTGFLSDQSSTLLNSTGRDYRNTAAQSYDNSVNQYNLVLQEFKDITRSSATSSIDKLLTDAYITMKDVSEAVSKTQSAITYIVTSQSDYYPSEATVAASNIKIWATTANSDVATILSAQDSISSANNALTSLTTGADALDIQTQQLSLKQKQDAYADYFIRAPFEGIVGRIPVNKYDQAGGGTVIATVVGTQKIATISLNEVDAAKVKAGQSSTVTFDAVAGLTETGKVNTVDLVGTVTQGVVTYSVKIALDTNDERIKTGMSADATIVTEEKPDVLLVPSTAVKTSGTIHYVETLNSSMASSTASRGARRFGQSNASSTAATDFATSSRTYFATSSRTDFSTSSRPQNQDRTFTISSKAVPQKIMVTVGDSNDTYTEITGGLSRGDAVITRTIAASAVASQSTTPNLFSTLGGNQRNVTRTATGGAGARTPAAGR